MRVLRVLQYLFFIQLLRVLHFMLLSAWLTGEQ